MRVIFFGDIVGEVGREAVKLAVPQMVEKWAPDFLVANGENAAGGNGITPRLVIDLFRAKVDVVTLGDHAWDQKEVLGFFAEEPRLLRPFNFPAGCPGAGSVVVQGHGKRLGVISAMGRTFMHGPVDNPFLGMGAEIAKVRRETRCIVVDFHAETTSEKIAFGHAMDGKVSAVLGTHTHVQTADEKILEGGTAYITDAGFCGPHDSVIGRDKRAIVKRFETLMPTRMPIATGGVQVDGVVVDIDEATGKATAIERFQIPVHVPVEGGLSGGGG
ncbi:MAG: TIGR00282 family metallophosphoesterase, partial [Verrucomicrobiia bacterium]